MKEPQEVRVPRAPRDTMAWGHLQRFYGKLAKGQGPGIIERIRSSKDPDAIRVNALRACTELDVPERVKRKWRAVAEERITELLGEIRVRQLIVPAA